MVYALITPHTYPLLSVPLFMSRVFEGGVTYGHYVTLLQRHKRLLIVHEQVLFFILGLY